MSKEKNGVIYILTNPSFPDYVKIGYTENLVKRLERLNRSECIPYSFRVYAVYYVTKSSLDKELHKILDNLNPDLRSIETFDGKERTREFYAMAPEEAYALLESIAKISDTEDRLQRMQPEGHEIYDEEIANEIAEEAQEKRSPFSFSKCGIPEGAEITFINDTNCIAKVVPHNKIEYNGEIYSLSRLAQILLGCDHSVQGPIYWEYNVEILDDIRKKLENEGSYN